MIPLISRHSDELAEICRRHHAKRLEVFGSTAAGDAPSRPWYGNDIDLKEDLENVFNRTGDILTLRITNHYHHPSNQPDRSTSHELHH